jgi:hypothetical protein
MQGFQVEHRSQVLFLLSLPVLSLHLSIQKDTLLVVVVIFHVGRFEN